MIEKLAIRGVRSFSPDREQSIEFYSPLTMIVGANGCGKTTIIECLKYGTTGQAPPGSSSGKAFVHDPKVSGVSEVKANIKIRFRNKSGAAMVVVRSMQLKQTKSTLTFKQMDGVIRTMAPDGTKASLTHKCSELDKSVPIFIGVTAAVLNSVIFCHQEESSWPLQEGAVLKKKFDEIFDSARYSKALEVLRKQKTELASRGRELAGDLKGLSADKIAADGFKKKIDEAQRRIAACDEDLARVDKRKAKVDAELEKLDADYAKVARAQKAYGHAERECDMLEGKLQTMVDNLGPSGMIDCGDAELATLEREHKEQEQTSKADEARLQRAAEEADREKTECRKLLSAADRDRGELAHERKRAAEDDDGDDGDDDDEAQDEAGVDEALEGLKAELPTVIGGAAPFGDHVATAVERQLRDRRDAAAAAEKEAAHVASSATEATAKVVAEKQAAVDEAGRSAATLTAQLNTAQRRAKEATDEIAKVRTVTVARAQSTGDQAAKAQADLDDFKRDWRQGGDVEAKLRETEHEERAIADLIAAEEVALSIVEANEAQMEELMVLDHARKAADAGFRDKYAEASGRVAALLARATDAAERDPPDVDEAEGAAAAAFVADCNKEVAAASKRAAADEADAGGQDAAAQAELRLVVSDHELKQRDLADAVAAQQLLGGDDANGDHPRRGLATVLDDLDALARHLADDDDDDDDDDDAEDNKAVARPEGLPTAAEVAPTGDLSDEVLAERSAEKDARALALTWARALKSAVAVKVAKSEARSAFSEELRSKLEKTIAKGCAKCPLCRRGFVEDADEEVEALQGLITGLALDFGDMERRSAALGLHIEALAAMAPAWRGWVKATTKVTRLRHEEPLARLAAAGKKAVAEASATRLREARASAEDAREAAALCDDLATLREDFEVKEALAHDKKAELDRLNDTLGSAGGVGASLRSTKDIVKKIQELQGDKTKKTEARLALERDKSNALQRENVLVIRVAELRRSAEAAAAELATKKGHEARRGEAQAQLRAVEGDLRALKHADAERRVELQKARDDREAELRRVGAERDATKVEAQAAAKAHEAFAAAVRRRAEGRRRHDDAARKEETLADREADAETRERQAVGRFDEAQAAIARMRSNDPERVLMTKRIKANIAHRAFSRDLAAKAALRDDLNKQLRALTREIRSNSSSSNADGCGVGGSIAQRREALAGQDRQLATDRGELAGRRNANVATLNETKIDLRSSRYKEVDEQHRTKMIKQQTTEMAVHDLELYWTSLDKALQNFHSMKIQEINRIVRELWSMTYMGEDIDQIEIVSGQEAGSSKAARSYNYHVQMRKGDAALDMKGRCSAGQRVLASIVIRLALAETFGLHCGILALDEPTTNLDNANRRSLASGLSRIIANRSRQQNFQLVVITHDEAFISSMRNELSSLREFNMPEHYWKVSRECVEGRHYSRIDKIQMDELM